MKKLSFILLMAVLALPMMGQTKVYGVQAARQTTPAKATVHSIMPKFATSNVRVDIPEGYCAITLNAADVWQDGTGYQMLLDADANTYGTVIPETGGLTTSGDASAATYAEFEYKIPENADGALTTQNIVLDDEVTILIPAGTYDWCITNPTPGDRLWIASANGNIPGRFDDYEFAAGATYIFYVTLGGTNDRVDLEIIDPTAPVMPENVTADENANIAWENDHDPMFNLRYRVYDPDVAQHLVWSDDTNLDDWMVYDADGDGYNWGLYEGDGNIYFGSASYQNYESLNPDNWLITPVVPFGGSLTFTAWNQSAYYLDHFDVYIAVGEGEEIEDFELLQAGFEPGTTAEVFTIDLSAYAGQEGRLAFRHVDCYDEWAIYLDDVTIDVPGNEPGEWTVVEGIEGNNYTIEGLDPNTTYEVEVQAVAADGRTTDWTEPVIFTTGEGGGVEPTEYCARPECAYAITDFETVTVTITNNEPDAIVVYSVYCGEELIEEGTFTGDQYQIVVTGPGDYVVHAVATMEGYLDSPDGGVFFTILPNDAPPVSIDELVNGKTVANVRYFNALGQEMQSANGMTIVVTTYTDGTTSTAKVVK